MSDSAGMPSAASILSAMSALNPVLPVTICERCFWLIPTARGRSAWVRSAAYRASWMAMPGGRVKGLLTWVGWTVAKASSSKGEVLRLGRVVEA